VAVFGACAGQDIVKRERPIAVADSVKMVFIVRFLSNLIGGFVIDVPGTVLIAGATRSATCRYGSFDSLGIDDLCLEPLDMPITVNHVDAAEVPPFFTVGKQVGIADSAGLTRNGTETGNVVNITAGYFGIVLGEVGSGIENHEN